MDILLKKRKNNLLSKFNIYNFHYSLKLSPKNTVFRSNFLYGSRDRAFSLKILLLIIYYYIKRNMTLGKLFKFIIYINLYN